MTVQSVVTGLDPGTGAAVEMIGAPAPGRADGPLAARNGPFDANNAHCMPADDVDEVTGASG